VVSPGRARKIHRVVNTGTSFRGDRALQQQHIGLGTKADRIKTLEIYWPTSKSVQTFAISKPNQAITIKEFASVYEQCSGDGSIVCGGIRVDESVMVRIFGVAVCVVRC